MIVEITLKGQPVVEYFYYTLACVYFLDIVGVIILGIVFARRLMSLVNFDAKKVILQVMRKEKLISLQRNFDSRIPSSPC